MRAVGIILAGGNSSRMKELTQKRAIAAEPIAGSFRAIDFALSNMSNSRVERVAVLTQYNSRSLNEHMSSSKWWNFRRKQGGLFVFPAMLTADNAWWYRGSADSIYQNINFLKESHEPYVVIASGDGVYKLDYNKVLEYHIAKRADITVVCTKCVDDELERFGVVNLNEDGRIIDFVEKPMVPKSNIISAGIYIIRRRLLIEFLEKCAKEDRWDFVNDIIVRNKDMKMIYGYMHEGYWSNISTVESYFRTNMDFLKPEVRKVFFKEEPFIYSKVGDNAPAKYNPGCDVSNSIVASGCIVNGVVENSVLFRNVFVGNGTVIKNSIVLNDVYIGENAHIENCIVESRDTIHANTYHKGDDGIKIVVEKNERYSL